MANEIPTTYSTGAFAKGDTASGTAQRLGVTPQDFLAANPNLAAKGALVGGQNKDFQGLTGLIGEGQAYNIPNKPPVNSGIIASGGARTDLANGSTQLDGLTTPGADPYMEYLQKQQQGLETRVSGGGAPGTEEKTAAAQGAIKQQQAEKDFEAYKAGLATLGIQTGLTRYAPSLQADRLFNAETAEKAQLAKIQQSEDLSIAKAKEARQNKDSVALKDAIKEVQSYRKEKAQTIKDQLAKRTQDITVAKGIAPYILEQIKNLPESQKLAYIENAANESGIDDVKGLHAALIDEQRAQDKSDLQMQRELQLINKITGSTKPEKPLSTAALNWAAKNTPMVDVGLSDTQGDYERYLAISKDVEKGVSQAYTNPELVKNGKFTYDYIKNALGNLPEGVSREGFLNTYKDKLALGKYKYAKAYGITEAEFNKLNEE